MCDNIFIKSVHIKNKNYSIKYIIPHFCSFPVIVHKLIEKLPDTRKFKKPNPNALPQPSPYAMDKYKLKECRGENFDFHDIF